MIIKEIVHYKHTACVVRGLPGNNTLVPSTNMIRFYNHLPAAALNEEMSRADLVIARSGYSTVMDVAALQKKSVLIPTPGQTEQEYLGEYLMKKQFAVCITQQHFSLANALKKAKEFDYQFAPAASPHILTQAVGGLIKSLTT